MQDGGAACPAGLVSPVAEALGSWMPWMGPSTAALASKGAVLYAYALLTAAWVALCGPRRAAPGALRFALVLPVVVRRHRGAAWMSLCCRAEAAAAPVGGRGGLFPSFGGMTLGSHSRLCVPCAVSPCLQPHVHPTHWAHQQPKPRSLDTRSDAGSLHGTFRCNKRRHTCFLAWLTHNTQHHRRTQPQPPPPPRTHQQLPGAPAAVRNHQRGARRQLLHMRPHTCATLDAICIG